MTLSPFPMRRDGLFCKNFKPFGYKIIIGWDKCKKATQNR